MKKQRDIIINNKFIAILIISTIILMTYCVAISQALPANTGRYKNLHATTSSHAIKQTTLKPLPEKLGGNTIKKTTLISIQPLKKITIKDWYIMHEKQRQQSLHLVKI